MKEKDRQATRMYGSHAHELINNYYPIEYTPQIGDIVNVRAKVINVHHTFNTTCQIEFEDESLETAPWVKTKLLTLVERPAKQLNPGDRIVHKDTQAEYLWIGYGWKEIKAKDDGKPRPTRNRNAVNYDSTPGSWFFYPRNELPEELSNQHSPL